MSKETLDKHKVGYARVSTHEQNIDLQIDALSKEGCHKIFEDQVSGAKSERPGLSECLNYLREGDTLVVWRLDRLGRSLKHLIDMVMDLQSRGVMIKSLHEGIDTNTATGQFFFHVTGAFAELERNLIRERTLAGLKAARARGRKGGRPKSVPESKLKLAKKLYDKNEDTVLKICKNLGFSRAKFYQYLKELNEREKNGKK